MLKPAEIATKMSNAKKENVALSSENVFQTGGGRDVYHEKRKLELQIFWKIEGERR